MVGVVSGEKLWAVTVEMEFLVVAEDRPNEWSARQYAEEELENSDLYAREITKPEQVPHDWRGLDKRGVPLVWGTDEDTTAEGWLLDHPHVPTEADLEAAGQLNAMDLMDAGSGVVRVETGAS